MYDEYWDAFEEFVRAAGHKFELRKLGSHAYFRRVPIDGVPVSHAHFAVAVSTAGSHLRPPGVRVQLVLEGKFASHYAPELVAQRSQIDGEIPDVHWLRGSGKASHIEVRTAHHQDQQGSWDTDFEWMLERLGAFQRVLGPRVQEARRLL